MQKQVNSVVFTVFCFLSSMSFLTCICLEFQLNLKTTKKLMELQPI